MADSDEEEAEAESLQNNTQPFGLQRQETADIDKFFDWIARVCGVCGEAQGEKFFLCSGVNQISQI